MSMFICSLLEWYDFCVLCFFSFFIVFNIIVLFNAIIVGIKNRMLVIEIGMFQIVLIVGMEVVKNEQNKEFGGILMKNSSEGKVLVFLVFIVRLVWSY